MEPVVKAVALIIGLFVVTLGGVTDKEFTRGAFTIKPQFCIGNADVLDARCCVFPPFYAREVAIKCGTFATLKYQREDQNVTGFARKGITCQGWRCILNSYNLLDRDRLNENRFYYHLNRWIKLNPEFTNAIQKAIAVCKKSYKSQIPIHVCKYGNYHSCLRNYVQIDCPLAIDSDICKRQKRFYDLCRTYFY